MNAARRTSEAGFTLIELMVGVAVIGTMAAVAVPMFTGSVKQAKSADVKAELMKMAMAAKVAYLNDGTFPQGTAQVLPAADGGNCRYQNHMIPVSGAWRDDAIWGNLDVMVSQPTQFSYHYTSSEAGLATITATADLNCDGILTTYSITVIDGVYDVASLETPTTSVAMGDELDADDDLETPTMSLPPDMGLPEGPAVPSEPIVTAAGGDVTPAAGAHHDDDGDEHGEHEDDDHDGHSGNHSGHEDDDHGDGHSGGGHDNDDDDDDDDDDHVATGGSGHGHGNDDDDDDDDDGDNHGNDNNRSGLGDGTNPGQGAGTGNSPNTGTDNPNNSNHDDDDDHGHGNGNGKK